uniref:hypothetical protein n=1 Tax=Fulvivirga sp. TaxID=1931237 RepID=UPI004049899A
IPECFKQNDDHLSLAFEIWDTNEPLQLTSMFNFPVLKGKVKIESKFPYNKFKLIDEHGNTITSRPASMLDHSEQGIGEFQKLLDYEVLYVGQAFGTDGNRNSLDRIIKHETLQEILNDGLNEHPDKEIFVLLGNFSRKQILMSLPYSEFNGKFNEELERHFFENSGFKISEKQHINLTEGMLIRYFQPFYNEKFKKNFPSKLHASYSELYKLNLRAIALEINSDHINTNLYSEKIGRKSAHFQNFGLTKKNGRFNIFELKM